MKHTSNKQNNKRHPLFGRVDADADLGIAMLIAETEDGRYEPNGPVSTVNEAIECASHDMASRMRDLELGGEPACPSVYKVWSRDYEGEYTVIYEIDAGATKPAKTQRRRK
jgi:hypothetical protein